MPEMSGRHGPGRDLLIAVVTALTLACGGSGEESPPSLGLVLMPEEEGVAKFIESPATNFLNAVKATGIAVDTFSTLAGAEDLSARLAGKRFLFLPSIPGLANDMSSAERGAIFTWMAEGGVVVAAGGSQIPLLSLLFDHSYVAADSFSAGATQFPRVGAPAAAPASLPAVTKVTLMVSEAAAAGASGFHTAAVDLQPLYGAPDEAFGVAAGLIVDETVPGFGIYLGWDWRTSGAATDPWNDMLSVMVNAIAQEFGGSASPSPARRGAVR